MILLVTPSLKLFSRAISHVSFVGVALFAIVGGATIWTAHDAARLPLYEEGIDDRPIEVLEGGYVSSRACKACHPGEYESWHRSYHRTMTQVVTPDTVAASLDGTFLELDGRSWKIERRGDRFWVEQRARVANGREQVREFPIVMSTGSHSMQVYWMGPGADRRIEMLPFHYLIAEQRWIPRSTAFLTPPGSEQSGIRWNEGCVNCHTTRGRPRVSGDDVDTHVAEFGISCEACHGPGLEHVRANQDPVRRYALHFSDKADETIVQPGRLSKERSAQVCGRCHAYGDPIQKDFHWMGYEYNAGEDLAKSKRVLQRSKLAGIAPALLDRMFWSDGMVRGSGREFGGLIESPCYERGEMTCISCHSMHRDADDSRELASWANDQLGIGMRGNEACLQCHNSYAEALEDHTRHAVESQGSNCYNCHMSYTTYGLLKAIRSHEVSSPSVQSSLETGRPNACSQCHLDRTLAWAADELAKGWGLPLPKLDSDHRNIAASVLWMLRGDAAQRALIAWSMGWEPARVASGRDWMAPHLAQLLRDPYPAVRWIAARSLETLPGFETLSYDFIASEGERREASLSVTAQWESRSNPDPGRGSQVLVSEMGLDRKEVARLLGQRNNRAVVVME